MSSLQQQIYGRVIYDSNDFRIFAHGYYCNKHNKFARIIPWSLRGIYRIVDYKKYIVVMAENRTDVCIKQQNRTSKFSELTLCVEYDNISFKFYKEQHYQVMAFRNNEIFNGLLGSILDKPVYSQDDFVEFLKGIGIEYNEVLADYGTIVYNKSKLVINRNLYTDIVIDCENVEHNETYGGDRTEYKFRVKIDDLKNRSVVYDSKELCIFNNAYYRKQSDRAYSLTDVYKIIEFNKYTVIWTKSNGMLYSKKYDNVYDDCITMYVEYNKIQFRFYTHNQHNFVVAFDKQKYYEDCCHVLTDNPIVTVDDFIRFIQELGETYNSNLANYGTVVYDKIKKDNPMQIKPAYFDMIIVVAE